MERQYHQTQQEQLPQQVEEAASRARPKKEARTLQVLCGLTGQPCFVISNGTAVSSDTAGAAASAGGGDNPLTVN